MGILDFGTLPLIQQELRRYFASIAQGEKADSALQPAAIGTTVQAHSDRLSSLAGLSAASGGIEKTGSNSFGAYTLTAFGKSLVAAADAAAGRSVLSLTIGSNVQAWSANLDGLAGVSTTGILERTGPGTFVATPQLGTTKIQDEAITLAKLAPAVQQLLLPAGAVIYVAGSAAPTGFLKANGATVNRTTYADLFAAIGTTYGVGDGSTTFQLPDLRGEFLRGWDDARGIDSGRSLGSAQAAAFASHNHGVTDPGHSHNFFRPLFVGGGDFDKGTLASNWSIDNIEETATGGASTGIAIQNTGGSETRPRNIALLACIKF